METYRKVEWIPKLAPRRSPAFEIVLIVPKGCVEGTQWVDRQSFGEKVAEFLKAAAV